MKMAGVEEQEHERMDVHEKVDVDVCTAFDADEDPDSHEDGCGSGGDVDVDVDAHSDVVNSVVLVVFLCSRGVINTRMSMTMCSAQFPGEFVCEVPRSDKCAVRSCDAIVSPHSILSTNVRG